MLSSLKAGCCFFNVEIAFRMELILLSFIPSELYSAVKLAWPEDSIIENKVFVIKNCAAKDISDLNDAQFILFL